MKRQFVGIFLSLSFVFSVSAQKTQISKNDAVEQHLRKHIEYLASDKLEGRRTGEPGATSAANYIAKQFAAIALRAGAKSNSGKPGYLQPFPYVAGMDPAKTTISIRLTTDGPNGKPLSANEPYGILPVGFSSTGSVSNAPITFAGYGIVSNEPGFDDYASGSDLADVKGKVVVVFDGNPDNDNPHSAFGRFDVRTKALIAKEHGAAGMLVISREEKFIDDRLTRMNYEQSLGEAAIPTFVISRDIARQILGYPDDASLRATEELTAKKKDGAKVSIGYRDVGPRITFDVDLVKRSVSASNVIGILEGTDPILKNEAIVIGAHYDHLGHGGQGSLDVNSTEIHHGADDNASGTAAILELAREFAKEKRNKRTLIFVAFSGEEEGLIGSKYYVNNPVFPLEKTVAMVNLDMVGRLKDQKLTIGGIGTASEWKGFVEKWNNGESVERNVHLAIPNAPSGSPAYVPRQLKSAAKFPTFSLQLNEDGFGPSDHSSFYGKKIPVLFFFTGAHENYHKPSDTADKINYDGLESVVSYVAEITKAIDQNPQRPTYTVAKSSGIGGGRSGFNISLGTVPSYVDSTDGMVLDGVRDNSPAARAGLKPGDKVVKLAGKDVRNVMDYTYILGEMKVGEEYEVIVIRGGEKVTLKIVPVKR